MKRFLTYALTIAGVLLVCDAAFAEDALDEVPKVIQGSHAYVYFAASVLAAGLGIAAATWLAALGQGNAIGKAVEGIARQPEASEKIQTAMIIGLAFIESLVIYALLIALIIVFLNPFKDFFIQ